MLNRKLKKEMELEFQIFADRIKNLEKRVSKLRDDFQDFKYPPKYKIGDKFKHDGKECVIIDIGLVFFDMETNEPVRTYEYYDGLKKHAITIFEESDILNLL